MLIATGRLLSGSSRGGVENKLSRWLESSRGLHVCNIKAMSNFGKEELPTITIPTLMNGERKGKDEGCSLLPESKNIFNDWD